MTRTLQALWHDESGNELVEYALLMGLIVIGAIGLMAQLGVKILGRYQQIIDSLG